MKMKVSCLQCNILLKIDCLLPDAVSQEFLLAKKQQDSLIRVAALPTIPVPALVDCRSDRIHAT